MPFELPDNLHPDCAPVAWLLGTWQGNGHGDYPTIEPYQFGQELIFTHDGRPFFHYLARAWIVDEDGEKVRDAALETGFLRCRPEGKLELLLAPQHRVRRDLVRRGGDRQVRAVRPTRSCAPSRPRSTSAASGSTASSRATCSTPTTWPRWARSSSPTRGRGCSAMSMSRDQTGARAPREGLPADAAARADPQRRRHARARDSGRGPGRGAHALTARSTCPPSTAPSRCSRSSAWCGTRTCPTARRPTTPCATTSTSTWSAGIATRSSLLTLMCCSRS